MEIRARVIAADGFKQMSKNDAHIMPAYILMLITFIKQSKQQRIFPLFSVVPSRTKSIKDSNVPTQSARIVLLYAVFWKSILLLITEYTVVIDDESIEQLALNKGHKKNVPITPPYKLKLYPL